VPDDKISLAQIRALPLSDQIQALMMNGNEDQRGRGREPGAWFVSVKAIQLKQLRSLLAGEPDEQTVLKSLQNCAALVRGNWVVRRCVMLHSHHIYAYWRVASASCSTLDTPSVPGVARAARLCAAPGTCA